MERPDSVTGVAAALSRAGRDTDERDAGGRGAMGCPPPPPCWVTGRPSRDDGGRWEALAAAAMLVRTLHLWRLFQQARPAPLCKRNV